MGKSRRVKANLEHRAKKRNTIGRLPLPDFRLSVKLIIKPYDVGIKIDK